MLLLAAKRLPEGRAVGIDLWSPTDQSGNSEETILRNAELEGVRERVELITGDMRRLPFPDRSFDVVTSSLAIHNIVDEEGREQALEEIWRVTKPGGTALVADFRHTDEYARCLAGWPGASVERRRLDWRFWYGGPQAATSLVTMRRRLGSDLPPSIFCLKFDSGILEMFSHELAAPPNQLSCVLTAKYNRSGNLTGENGRPQ